jgi:GxxExxY protein
MEVHRELGCGFSEPIYQEAFTIELVNRQIPFTKEIRCRINYKDRVLSKILSTRFHLL